MGIKLDYDPYKTSITSKRFLDKCIRNRDVFNRILEEVCWKLSKTQRDHIYNNNKNFHVLIADHLFLELRWTLESVVGGHVPYFRCAALAKYILKYHEDRIVLELI